MHKIEKSGESCTDTCPWTDLQVYIYSALYFLDASLFHHPLRSNLQKRKRLGQKRCIEQPKNFHSFYFEKKIHVRRTIGFQ
jgi:hypothetical protein